MKYKNRSLGNYMLHASCSACSRVSGTSLIYVSLFPKCLVPQVHCTSRALAPPMFCALRAVVPHGFHALHASGAFCLLSHINLCSSIVNCSPFGLKEITKPLIYALLIVREAISSILKKKKRFFDKSLKNALWSIGLEY